MCLAAILSKNYVPIKKRFNKLFVVIVLSEHEQSTNHCNEQQKHFHYKTFFTVA